MKILFVLVVCFYQLNAIANPTYHRIDKSILEEIKRSEIKKPSRQLNYFRKEGVSSYRSVSSNKADKSVLNEEVWLKSRKEELTYTFSLLGDGYKSKGVFFLGSIPLYQEQYKLADDLNNELTLIGVESARKFSLYGNWKSMSQGETIGYTLILDSINPITGSGEMDYSTSCKIKNELKASQLNNSLKGMAKKLECVDSKDNEIVSTRYYLQDYGLMFQAKFKNNFFQSEGNIVKVEQN